MLPRGGNTVFMVASRGHFQLLFIIRSTFPPQRIFMCWKQLAKYFNWFHVVHASHLARTQPDQNAVFCKYLLSRPDIHVRAPSCLRYTVYGKLRCLMSDLLMAMMTVAIIAQMRNLT